MIFVLLPLLGLSSAAHLPLVGVSLSGAEFGAYPGVYGKDYTWPTMAEVDYFGRIGMTTIRVPFLWERLQPTPKGDFDANYLSNLTTLVSYMASKSITALVDPHNYARYFGQIVGAAGSATSAADFGAFWAKLAVVPAFLNNKYVVFAIMNEPNTMKTEDWLTDANSAVAAIRAAGATNFLLVPGNAWTGASSWAQNWYGTANAEVMLGFKDPNNNFAFEVHQYLDTDHSGTHPDCVSGAENFKDFTAWAKVNKVKGFLGEFAGGNNPTCQTKITEVLQFLEANSDVFIGFTWWSAGPWWGDYMYSLEPTASGGDAPQTAWLKPFF